MSQPPSPYGQEPGVPQPGGFPQQDHPQTGGHPGGDPQPRKNRPLLPWILGGAGVVVVALVIVLVLTLTGGGTDTGSAQGVAHAAVAAFNQRDLNAANKLLCDQNDTADSLGVNEFEKVEVHASLKADPQVSGDTATATINMDLTYQGRHITQDFKLSMKRQGGNWCVDGLGSAPSGG